VRGGRVAVLQSDRFRPLAPEEDEKKKASDDAVPSGFVGQHAHGAPTDGFEEITGAVRGAPEGRAPAVGARGAAAPAMADPAAAEPPPAPPPPPPPAQAAAPAVANNGDLKLGGAAVRPGRAGEGLAQLGRDTAGAGGVFPSAGEGQGAMGPIGVVAVGETTASLPISDSARVVAGMRARFRRCYQQGLALDPTMAGRLVLDATVNKLGQVMQVTPTGAGLSAAASACVVRVVKSSEFSPPGGDSHLRIALTFTLQQPGSSSPPTARPFEAPQKPTASKPYDGPFKTVMELLARGDKDGAVTEARRWQATSSGDVMALVGLGEALEAKGDVHGAARAYGSILELFASRADSRRFAGERLERLQDPFALELAADTFEKAREQRGDHPASHRLYAFTLLKAGQYEKAFHAIADGAKRTYPEGRFAGAFRILHEDVGLIAAAWTKAEPKRSEEIAGLRRDAGGTDESNPSVRFVLVWETDANDVDFHIYDGKGGHAYYGNRQLPSGGELYADVTTGYGPECFTIRGPQAGRAYPYTLQAHYYSRGPMGYGMGKLQIIDHDGKGGLTFVERPFVVMVDRAFVDLGVVERPKRE
jgi:tetratricopeptide (TPR) repeat protein